MCNDAEQKFFLINIPAHNKKIFVKEDVSLADALRAVGIGIETPCGGHGLCGGCLIRVLNGELDILDADREKIPNSMLKDGYRLACRKRKFHTSISIEVPQRKRKIDLSAIPQNVSGRFAFSVDIGTTTIAVSLLNADTGAEAGSMSFANPQDEYGADVISRVSAITNDPEILQVLRKMTVESLNDGFKRLLRASRVKAEDIQFISIAGNSIMEHIILGISPVPLSVYPFELVERFPAVKTAAQMGFIFLNNATVKVFPMAGANLGGDAVAGIFYLDLDKKGSPRMLIDIGTNVEIVLSKQEGLFATSSPAGPAFEGGEITFGMRA
ncbi:MAG TPA: ASKHA domain-containing protein, partial [bacterium]